MGINEINKKLILIFNVLTIVCSFLVIHSIYMAITRNDIVCFVFTIIFLICSIVCIICKKLIKSEVSKYDNNGRKC